MNHVQDHAQITVLVVDDNVLARTTIALDLEEHQHQVIVASDARVALEHLHSRSDIRVMIVDQMMPVMGGLSLMNLVQRDWPDVSIIVCSGVPPTEPLPNDVVFVAKPYKVGQLNAAVQVSVLTQDHGLR